MCRETVRLVGYDSFSTMSKFRATTGENWQGQESSQVSSLNSCIGTHFRPVRGGVDLPLHCVLTPAPNGMHIRPGFFLLAGSKISGGQCVQDGTQPRIIEAPVQPLAWRLRVSCRDPAIRDSIERLTNRQLHIHPSISHCRWVAFENKYRPDLKAVH